MWPPRGCVDSFWKFSNKIKIRANLMCPKCWKLKPQIQCQQNSILWAFSQILGRALGSIALAIFEEFAINKSNFEPKFCVYNIENSRRVFETRSFNYSGVFQSPWETMWNHGHFWRNWKTRILFRTKFCVSIFWKV